MQFFAATDQYLTELFHPCPAVYDFNFHYRCFKSRQNIQARTNAALAVGLTISFHVMCAGVILRHYGLISLGKPLSEDYVTNKMMMLPYALIITYLFTWYYSHKRAMAIVNKWPKDYEVLTVRNVALVALIMLGPLSVIIAFLKH